MMERRFGRMRSERAARLLALAALLVMAAGCGAIRRSIESAGEEPPVDPEAILVHVRNNLSPPTALTVFVITDAGTRARLGTMSGSTTERFVVDVPPVGRVRFYGRTDDGREVASNPVSLRPRQQLEWDVFANVVTERFGEASSLTPSGATAPGR
jgi:hypothetical protein